MNEKQTKERIIEILGSFKFEVSSIKTHVGPSVSFYEVELEKAIRYSRLRYWEDDIALNIAPSGVRIIAPLLRGVNTLGIEIPNIKRDIVPVHAILSSKEFQETTMELPIALGKTCKNEVYMIDLTKAPHMLIAGATGQGKTNFLNTVIASLIHKKQPEELKLVLIDPKCVEFSVYKPLESRYLLKMNATDDSIITDINLAVQVVNSLCVEMDMRYDLLKKADCQNLKEYNKMFIEQKLNTEEGHRFMPYIVTIIDEYGDLIMSEGKNIELPICRIAQLAKAVGIHIIISTQRPTGKIITGTIKANIPTSMAFRVADKRDSRTILNCSGAEQLIGDGDMLYNRGLDVVRIQSAFIDKSEIKQFVEHFSKKE